MIYLASEHFEVLPSVVPLAAAFAVLNAMWYELVEDDEKKDASS